MSLKKTFLIVILILVILAGGYIVFFGLGWYTKYSAPERDFNNLSSGDFLNDMLVKGDIEAVTGSLGSQSINNEVLGIRVSKATAWNYYVLPLEYHEDKTQRKYCAIAVSRAEDIQAVEALLKDAPVPRDPNAPRFEFRGITMNMNIDVRTSLSKYLWNIYDTDFNIYNHANVSRYIVPYTIYVRSGNEGGIKPIIIGAAIVLTGGILLTVLFVNTYRKNNMY